MRQELGPFPTLGRFGRGENSSDVSHALCSTVQACWTNGMAHFHEQHACCIHARGGGTPGWEGVQLALSGLQAQPSQ